MPRQYYYDRLARTAFWTALAAFLVMVLHLAALGLMMWRHARVPNVMWFPRIEIAVCLAILPALAYGPAGECMGGLPACLLARCGATAALRYKQLLRPLLLAPSHLLPPPPASPASLPLQACSIATLATLCWAPSCWPCCPAPSWAQPSSCCGAGCSAPRSTAAAQSLCCGGTPWGPRLRRARPQPPPASRPTRPPATMPPWKQQQWTAAAATRQRARRWQLRAPRCRLQGKWERRRAPGPSWALHAACAAPTACMVRHQPRLPLCLQVRAAV